VDFGTAVDTGFCRNEELPGVGNDPMEQLTDAVLGLTCPIRQATPFHSEVHAFCEPFNEPLNNCERIVTHLRTI
jgi:hypothetical protein